MKADSCLWLSRKGCPARISALSFPLLLQPSIFFLRQYSVNKLRSHTTISQIPPWETGSGGEGGKISGFSPSSYFPHFRPSFFRERCQIMTDENSQSLLRRSPVRSGGRSRKERLIGFGLNYAEGGTKNFRRRRLRCHTEMLSSREN